MFTGPQFEPYKLTEVKVTDQELGHGSYATVIELDYMGLKCAGKKIHEVLLRQGDTSYTVRRFEEECHLLSQIRHPNIVQFLGVYFQQGVQAPILVLEFLPTNLTSCIEQSCVILPKEISYSILHDVALGLCYLHSQTPPIIHRDLSSNNVLLTSNMTAKISDLGVARILSMTTASRMTQAPGTPAYMPPEVMVADPKYDTSVDEFSYGILMIHVFCGRWPEPQTGPNRRESGKLIPVTEAERRDVFLQAIGNDHPLMELILKCIDDDPQARAHATEIVEKLSKKVLPTSFTNRLEMLRRIEVCEEEKSVLIKEKERQGMEIQQKQEQISIMQEKALNIEQQEASEINQLKLAHSSEVAQLETQIKDMSVQNQLAKGENDTKVTKLTATISAMEAKITGNDHVVSTKDAEIEAKTRALEEKNDIISKLREQLTTATEYLATKQQVGFEFFIFYFLGREGE